MKRSIRSKGILPTSDRRESGAVAVEFALVAPLLLALVAGIVEFSFVYNTQISLSQAAREAAKLRRNKGLVRGHGFFENIPTNFTELRNSHDFSYGLNDDICRRS
ncbi:TadE family protein [Arthrobacter sp. UYEF21]|uniref:TadE family protein n=1 Tax=Arthrobacter sp. UYEF21 TaxID=1756364 RepID=UPI003394B3F9